MTTITMQHLWHMGVSWSPLFSESAFVFEALPQNCFVGAADLSALCLQFHACSVLKLDPLHFLTTYTVIDSNRSGLSDSCVSFLILD